MGNRGMDAPLAVQMDRLKKSINKRDKRRDEDRYQRLVSMSKDDPYAQVTENKPSAGSGIRSDAAAQAAVLNAAALEGPAQIRCELCQANFRNEAMLRQHEEGPAHKKALAKEKARLEREAWMENPSAASNALQAAAWLGGSERRTWQSVRPAAQAPAAQAPKPKSRLAEPPEPAKPSGMTHAQRIARAHKADEPLNINGWVPPTLDFVPDQEPAAEQAESDSEHDSGSEALDEDLAGEHEVDQQEAQQALHGREADGLDPAPSKKEEERNKDGTEGQSLGLGLGAYDSSSDDESGKSPDAEPPTSYF